MKLSVLICTRNRPDDIRWALPSVLSNQGADYEVVVVDQSDGDDTVQIVRHFQASHPHLRFYPTATRGLSRARNLAIRQAVGDVLLFTDDDCETGTGWVARAAALFEEDPALDLVFGQVRQPEGITDPTLAVPCLHFDARRVLEHGAIFGMGANMAFRRRLVERIGLYDECLGAGEALAGGEDFDFSYRAQKAGMSVVADPTLVLTHRATRTPAQWKHVNFSYGTGDAGFYAKHVRLGDPWARRHLAHSLLRALARGVAKAILCRRPNNDWTYLTGLRQGLWDSRAYAIDKETLLYARPQSKPAADAKPVEAV